MMDHNPAAPLTSPAGRLWQSLLVWVITILFIIAAALILILPLASNAESISLTVGESATQDILAPEPIRYFSPALTEKARVEAAAQVADIYDAPDARVARQQVLLLRDILEFINSVRADELAPPEQKQADLLALRDVSLTAETAQLILGFSETQWAAAQAEALAVLEQVMRSQVRANQIEDVRRSVPARVSVDLSEAQAQAVSVLVAGLIAPNTFYNESATQAAREAARQNIAPVYQQIVRGQAIVVRGQVVTPEAIEALEALGLLRSQRRWPEVLSTLLTALISGLLLILYIRRFNPEFSSSIKHVLLLGFLFLAFLLAAKLMVPDHTLLPYMFPAAALSMLLTVVVGPHLAIAASIALAALVGYLGGNRLELTLYCAIGGIVAALALGNAERVNQFFWAGLAAAVANVGVVLAFHLGDPALDVLGLGELILASLLNGVLISAPLTLAAFFLLGGLFDITTSLQLIELARPDHPLLKFILRNAPGTYQHSLQVANLAEQAAERVGANAMLIRVGALYHDAGKALHPDHFVENQRDGINLHDSLKPYASAELILAHVYEGLKLARRYRLPSRIRAFIAEHHGTLKTMYQYKKALEAADNQPELVDESKFTYPGPRPQSKETALLMLADGCEAKVRADHPQSEEEIDRIVKQVIDDRVMKGQLDDTDLTLHDLHLIRESFVNALKGVFHPRLQYPEETPAFIALVNTEPSTPLPPPADDDAFQDQPED